MADVQNAIHSFELSYEWAQNTEEKEQIMGRFLNGLIDKDDLSEDQLRTILQTINKDLKGPSFKQEATRAITHLTEQAKAEEQQDRDSPPIPQAAWERADLLKTIIQELK